MSIMVCCKLRRPILLLVFTYLWLWWCTTSIHVQAANDSLKPGDTLNASTEICSKNNKYCMSFDQPVADSSPIYLRIYATKNDDWEVWIANRNQPLDSDSPVLSLNHSGALKIESKDEESIILCSSPQEAANNVVATLLDTGNFVLQQLHPNRSTKSVLWQSFDHPTDTLVPEMKLGVNHKTGRNWSLVSYLSKTIPTPGAFSLEWDPGTRELIIKRHGRVCWKSGELRNNRFEHIPKDKQSIYNYTYVSNKDEDSFTFTTLNDEPTGWTLLETGQLMSRGGDDIARADMCYGYNTDGGCQRWEEIPSCRHHGDVFEDRVGYPNYSGNSTSYQANTSGGPSDCKASCWSNCNCVGFREYFDNGTGCAFFLGKSMEGFNAASGGFSFYMLVKKPQHKGKKEWIWICAVIANALLIICPSILYLAWKKRKYMDEDKKSLRMETEMPDSTYLEDDLNKAHDLKVFSYESVIEATNGFSSENKLGQGGFGPVYKGILPTGQQIAVKRLSKTSGQGVVEFRNELTLISELQHMNLVQLLGHCIHEQEPMLIYEYMPNKSLDFFLFDYDRSKLLNWEKRFSIIEGIAQGLLYLHKYSRLRIIHRDLKAGNILLDENMNPKISDFGLARKFMQHELEANTTRIVGTYGYMSPEYAMGGVISTKSDVYSLGVLLLEIISGKKNNSFCTPERPLNLVGHAWELWNQGKVLQLMDPALKESFVQDEVLKCVQIGLLCVEERADDRPNMSDIISMLTSKSAVSSVPRRPAYYAKTMAFEEEIQPSREFEMDTTCEISRSLSHSI